MTEADRKDNGYGAEIEKTAESVLAGNPCVIPAGVTASVWIEVLAAGFARAYGYLERGKRLFRDAAVRAYADAGVFDAGSQEEAAKRSESVTIRAILDNITEKREPFMERFNSLSGDEAERKNVTPAERFIDFVETSRAFAGFMTASGTEAGQKQ